MTSTKGTPTDSGDDPRTDQAFEDDFDRLVDEGDERLSRRWISMVMTGLVGGIDVGTGVLAYLVVESQTHSRLLAGLAFSIGFVALTLARGELFTENFLVPVTAVVAARRNAWSLARLWVLTLAANLAGGFLVTWLIVTAYPDLHETAVQTADHYIRLGTGLRSLALAVLAGMVITLMTRMQHATDSLGVKLVPAVLFGALLAGGQLFHSVLDSLFAFTALHTGSAPFGYADWAGMLGWSALGNVIGGLLLVTFIRLARVPRRVAQERERNTR